jgi:pullulanase
VTRVGFIAIYGCTTVGGDSWPGGTKDYDGDRYVDMAGDTTIYLKRGDPMFYYTEEEANAVEPVISSASMTSFTTIKYVLPKSQRITSLDQIKVMDGERQIEVVGLSTLNNSVNHGVVTVAEALDLSKVYTLQLEGYGSKMVIPTAVFDSAEFIRDYTYDGNDLGATIQEVALPPLRSGRPPLPRLF